MIESLFAKAGEWLITTLGLAGLVIIGLSAFSWFILRYAMAIQAARVEDAKSMAMLIQQFTVATTLAAEIQRQIVVEVRESAARDQLVISEIRVALAGLDRRRGT